MRSKTTVIRTGRQAGIGRNIGPAPTAADGTPNPYYSARRLSVAARSGHAGPRLASWVAARRCAPRCKRCWSSGTALPRSPGLLAATYPDRPEMQVSHEIIYRALYVQGRGELRRELTKCLRTGRALRRPRKRTRVAEARAESRHGQHQRTSRRGRGPRGARALGGRPDHRQGSASQIGNWSNAPPDMFGCYTYPIPAVPKSSPTR